MNALALRFVNLRMPFGQISMLCSHQATIIWRGSGRCMLCLSRKMRDPLGNVVESFRLLCSCALHIIGV